MHLCNENHFDFFSVSARSGEAVCMKKENVMKAKVGNV